MYIIFFRDNGAIMDENIIFDLYNPEDILIIKKGLEYLYNNLGKFTKLLVNAVNFKIASKTNLNTNNLFFISAELNLKEQTMMISTFDGFNTSFIHEIVRYLDFYEFMRFKGIKNYLEIKDDQCYFSLIENNLMSEKRALPCKIAKSFKKFCGEKLNGCEYFSRAIEQYLYMKANLFYLLNSKSGYCPKEIFQTEIESNILKCQTYYKNYSKVIHLSNDSSNFVSYSDQFDEMFPGYTELNNETEETLSKSKNLKHN
jgi:hypothetical protein